MGAPEHERWLLELIAALDHSSPLARCLISMTQYAEQPSPAQAQQIVCQLDCVAEDEETDAATRAISALLAQRWLFGAESACEQSLQPRGRRLEEVPRRRTSL